MIVQEGLNSSSLHWRKIVYDFLDEARRGIVAGSAYKKVLLKLEAAGADFQWAENHRVPSREE
jgi:hypothetical protein